MPTLTPNERENSNDQARKKIRTLSLVVTRGCNLFCGYCYEKHNQRESQIMDFEIAKDAILEYMNLDDEYNILMVDIFGGEPLLAFPLIKKIFAWCHSLQWKKKYQFVIGTNGTLLNDEMKDWFTQHRKYIHMALSLDGNRTAHNICRDNSYDLIFPHIEFFKKNWPFQPAKMTICAETIPYMADSIMQLEEMGLYFTSNIVFENFWGSPDNKKQLLKIYEEQLMRLVDFYIEHSHLYPVYPLLGILPFYLGIPGFAPNDQKDCVRYCGAGHEMSVVDVDGSRYPCHRFLPWVSGKPAPMVPINRQTTWEPDKCADCKIVHSCPTCAGYNWEENNDTGIRSTYHCEAHKLEVLASARIAAHRFKQIPLSQLQSLSPEGRSALNSRVNAVIDLIENGL